MSDKTQKVDNAIEKGKEVAEAVKKFTPPEIDNLIDRGEQITELGWGITKMFKNLFKKKKK